MQAGGIIKGREFLDLGKTVEENGGWTHWVCWVGHIYKFRRVSFWKESLSSLCMFNFIQSLDFKGSDGDPPPPVWAQHLRPGLWTFSTRVRDFHHVEKSVGVWTTGLCTEVVPLYCIRTHPKSGACTQRTQMDFLSTCRNQGEAFYAFQMGTKSMARRIFFMHEELKGNAF